MRLLAFICTLLLSFNAQAQIGGGPFLDRSGGSSFAGGVLVIDTTMADGIKFCLGTGCDYWLEYNSTSTQFELWTTDADGAGADALLATAQDGARAITFPATGASSILIGTGLDILGANGIHINTGTTGQIPVGSDRVVAIGNNVAIGADTDNAVCIGNGASCTVDGSIAIGNGTTAENNAAIAIGNVADCNTNTGAICIGYGANVVGAVAPYAIAIGRLATVGNLADGAIAIGKSATIGTSHTYSVALGEDSATTAANQMMIGDATKFLDIVTHGDLTVAGDASVTGTIIGGNAIALQLDTATHNIELPQNDDATNPTLCWDSGTPGSCVVGILQPSPGILHFNLNGTDADSWNMSANVFGGEDNFEPEMRQDATTTVPSYRWAADTDTGMGRTGADSLALYAGGAEIVGVTTAGAAVTGTFSSTGASNVGGAFTLTPSTANGVVVTGFTPAEQTITFAGGGGEASKSTSGLVPDGAILHGVSTYTLVTGTGCSSADYGDGTTVDFFGNNIALTSGTTTTPANQTANTANPQWNGGADVEITGVGANCVDLSVRVIAIYTTIGAPTD